MSFARLAEKFERGDRGFKNPDLKAAFVRVTGFVTRLKKLTDIKTALPQAWATALTELAEDISRPDAHDTMPMLWRGDAGEKATQIISSLIAYGDSLGEMDARSFVDLFSTLMRGKVVRPRYGMDPRLKILGPIEARMIEADLIIMGGLNEGLWLKAPWARRLTMRWPRPVPIMSGPAHLITCRPIKLCL
jgi:inactivated superfamily I helicase